MKTGRETGKTQKPTHYVGIGASAGGLEAIELFFKNMPPSSILAKELMEKSAISRDIKMFNRQTI